jgi:hypothetical protein
MCSVEAELGLSVRNVGFTEKETMAICTLYSGVSMPLVLQPAGCAVVCNRRKSGSLSSENHRHLSDTLYLTEPPAPAALGNSDVERMAQKLGNKEMLTLS